MAAAASAGGCWVGRALAAGVAPATTLLLLASWALPLPVELGVAARQAMAVGLAARGAATFQTKKMKWIPAGRATSVSLRQCEGERNDCVWREGAKRQGIRGERK